MDVEKCDTHFQNAPDKYGILELDHKRKWHGKLILIPYCMQRLLCASWGPEVEITEPISYFSLFFRFPMLSKRWLLIEYRVHIWQV